MKRINTYRIFCERHYDKETAIQKIAEDIYNEAYTKYKYYVKQNKPTNYIKFDYNIEELNIDIKVVFDSDRNDSSFAIYLIDSNTIIVYFDLDKVDKSKVINSIAHEVRHCFDFNKYPTLKTKNYASSVESAVKYYNSNVELAAYFTEFVAECSSVIDDAVTRFDCNSNQLSKYLLYQFKSHNPTAWRYYTDETKNKLRKNIYRYAGEYVAIVKPHFDEADIYVNEFMESTDKKNDCVNYIEFIDAFNDWFGLERTKQLNEKTRIYIELKLRYLY